MKLYRVKNIYSTNTKFYWNKTHTQVPVIDLYDNYWRVYYSSRCNEGKSRISYVDFLPDLSFNKIQEYNKPLLDLGKNGSFDDCGIMPSCIVHYNDLIYLYYIGWTKKQTVPYHNSIGLAISKDGGKTFNKVSDGPILSTNINDPYFLSASFVLIDDNIWKMWYLSCVEWRICNDKIEPLYHIKYTTSNDGITWSGSNNVVIPLKNSEGGITNPYVIKYNGKYYMWYSYRGISDYRSNSIYAYKIGYATSFCGLKWDRHDNIKVIGNSIDDNIMMCYSSIFIYKDNIYILYNGNEFGKHGINLGKMQLS